ncbi:mechanosensitive ion channel [Spirulina sp. CS-785/01]|uniref:mechanosensitive ion channel domain-containing protein n=1 Tax=Spirulina sp. CS-785/01 TaxID=3021716 RepID=UPI00232D5494|nr:mechanosensitive ion channel domain-containing protein [Spirulina sp. CS-785/01]MDB9311539.1 mechanosensitive ion channel [Spirulina sp. CS-785/01]
MLRSRIYSIFLSSLLLGLAITGNAGHIPVVAQEAAAEGETAAEEEETATEELTPLTPEEIASAKTAEDPSIPVKELELLLRPLTVEELQIEATAWFALLKAKVQEISEAEIAIQRQNNAIRKEEEAAAALEQAKTDIEEAEEEKADAEPNSPEFEAAAKKIEEAKEKLQEAQLALEEANENKQSLAEDEALTGALEKAEETQDIDAARKTLDAARTYREELTAGSVAYDALTDSIDVLNTNITDFEKAQENQQKAIPDSPEFEQATQELATIRAKVVESRETLINLLPEEARPEIKSIPKDNQGEEPQNNEGGEAPEGEVQGNAPEGEATDEVASVLENTEIDDDNQTEVAGTPAVEDPEAAEEQKKELEEASEQLKEEAEAETELKNQLVVTVTELQAQQTALIDRLQTVLAELEKKGGDISSYEKYIQAASAVQLDIEDTEGLGLRIMSWLKSEEGGLRWGGNIATFVAIFVVSVLGFQLLGLALNFGLKKITKTSALFREFLVILVKRGGIVVGLLLGLTALEVSLGPLLALVGGVSFILAFALQSNLGNFASGLMLLLYKPFDVDDEVEIAGQWALIKEITLANTVLQVWGQGRIISIPNSTVWGSTIVNHTPKDGIRKLVEKLYVNVNEDLVEVKQIIDDTINNHPLVLKEGFWAGSFVWQVKDVVEIFYVARSKADDYWTLYEELVLQIHSRLREKGIVFAAPEYRVFMNPDVEHKAYMQPQLESEVKTQSRMGLDFEEAN